MAILVKCGSCSRRFRASHRSHGQRTACPGCGAVVTVSGERVKDHDVFLSYSADRFETAKITLAALEAKDIRCWAALRDLSADDDRAVAARDAIDDSRVVVKVSRAGSPEEQVAREIEHALAGNIPVVSLRVSDDLLSPILKPDTHRVGQGGPLELPLKDLIREVKSLLRMREESIYLRKPKFEAQSSMLRRLTAATAGARGKRLAALAAVVTVLVLVTAPWWRQRRAPLVATAPEPMQHELASSNPAKVPRVVVDKPASPTAEVLTMPRVVLPSAPPAPSAPATSDRQVNLSTTQSADSRAAAGGSRESDIGGPKGLERSDTEGAFLSDMIPTFTTNGWGSYERDRSNGETGAADGHAIKLNGVAYSKGLGVHAASELRYNLGRGYSTFSSDIGVDDECGAVGSVVFKVYGDGRLLYDSGRMTTSSPTKRVNVSVAGVSELRLVVTDAGDGGIADHADWANPKLLRSIGQKKR
jgi:hypothetical protein